MTEYTYRTDAVSGKIKATSLQDAMDRLDAREIAEYEHWMSNPRKAARRLTELVDYLDEHCIGMGDHSDRPLLIAARDMVESLAEARS